MARLTQLIILSASQRDDRGVELPAFLRLRQLTLQARLLTLDIGLPYINPRFDIRKPRYVGTRLRHIRLQRHKRFLHPEFLGAIG